MNKLISRNPVQKFKQGRKIVKAQNSWGKDFGTEYIPPKNVTEVPKDWSYSINLGTANSWNMDNDIVNHDFSPYNPNQNLNYPHSGLVADAYNDSQDTQQRALQIATHNIKKASEPFHRRSYDNSVMDPERSYKAENKRLELIILNSKNKILKLKKILKNKIKNQEHLHLLKHLIKLDKVVYRNLFGMVEDIILKIKEKKILFSRMVNGQHHNQLQKLLQFLKFNYLHLQQIQLIQSIYLLKMFLLFSLPIIELKLENF